MQTNFEEFRLELNGLLEAKFKKRLQNGRLEAEAQTLVNQVFKQRNARNKLPTIECGLTIIGCNLGFDVGQISVRQWLTKFTVDQCAVHKQVPGAIALGYSNDFQLYAERRHDLVYLVARSSLLEMTGWCPVVQGVPPSNTVHFVALERARMLGYLDFLRGEPVDLVTNNVERPAKTVILHSEPDVVAFQDVESIANAILGKPQ